MGNTFIRPIMTSEGVPRFPVHALPVKDGHSVYAGSGEMFTFSYRRMAAEDSSHDVFLVFSFSAAAEHLWDCGKGFKRNWVSEEIQVLPPAVHGNLLDFLNDLIADLTGLPNDENRYGLYIPEACDGHFPNCPVCGQEFFLLNGSLGYFLCPSMCRFKETVDPVLFEPRKIREIVSLHETFKQGD